MDIEETERRILEEIDTKRYYKAVSDAMETFAEIVEESEEIKNGRQSCL